MRKNKAVLILMLIVALLLAGEAGFLLYQMKAPSGNPEPSEIAVTEAPETEAPTTVQTEPPTEAAPETTEAPTAEPETEPATEVETEPETEPETVPEPQPQHYTLSFAGDCTLGSAPNNYGIMYSFIWTIGEDYDYPFANVREYFENDDFTIVNLEGVLAEGGNSSDKLFTFRGPTAYTNILTGSSVEAVTLANNHTMDYGKDGYASTVTALEEAGVAYVEQDKSMMYTTESGLTVGVYAGAFTFNGEDMRAQIATMRRQGADVIIVAAHWGEEGSYRPHSGQTSFAHACIDAGADIVYGHHPHVLQPIEEYNGGVIFYSMGNFCFGGHHWPADLDSVILQQEVIREVDGSVHLGELTKIPCAISSITKTAQNNFQPTPYEEGSEKYERVLSKLDGTFKGANLNVDYK